MLNPPVDTTFRSQSPAHPFSFLVVFRSPISTTPSPPTSFCSSSHLFSSTFLACFPVTFSPSMYATTTLTRVLSGNSKIALMILCFTISLFFIHLTPAASSHINITPAVILFAPFPSALFTPGVPHACNPPPPVRYLAAAAVSSCFVSCNPMIMQPFSLKYSLMRLAFPVSSVVTPPSHPPPAAGKKALSFTS